MHDWSATVGSYLGRFDILAQVMSMSRFRLAHKTRHLERLKRLYGYLSKTKHFAIRYRTKEPNYSHLPEQEHDWSRTVYENVKEEIPKDIPKQLGRRVITTTFLDAIYAMILSLEGQSQQCYTSSTLPQLTGQKDKLRWRQPHMNQGL